jgi:hypothetical protein
LFFIVFYPLLFRKTIKNVVKISLHRHFNTSNNRNYNLRGNELDFALPKPNTNYLKKSFSYSGAALWNDLPKCAKDRAISVGQFRAILNNMEERACE